MAKVKMLTSLAGVSFSYRRNEVVNISDERADSYCASGVAERVTETRLADGEYVASAKAVKKTAARRPSTKK